MKYNEKKLILPIFIFSSVNKFKDALALMYKGPKATPRPVGDWYPVWGAVTPGDRVVQKDQINLVVKDGTNPLIVKEGIKVTAQV